MKIAVSVFLLAAALPGSISLGSPSLAQSASPTSACGAASINYSVKLDSNPPPQPQPASDKALVYFIQDAGTSATLGYPTTRLGVDGAWVGANHNSSYFSVPVEPGERHLCAMIQSSFVGNSVELAHFTAEPGKVYYFRTRLLLARNIEYLELVPIDSDEGVRLVSIYPLSVSQPKK